MPLPTFAAKDWQNAPSTKTPISAEALEDLEVRLSDYTEEHVQLITKGTDWSVGDLVCAQLAHNVAGVKLDMRHGNSGSPVTVAQPTLKVSRVEKIARTTIAAITGSVGSDGAGGLSAGHFSAKGVAGSEAQANGVVGTAINESSYEGEDGPDAGGGYFQGRITGGTSTKASCYGIVAYGRRDVDTAVCNGAEIGSLNFTKTAESYSPNGTYPSGKARGIWLIAHGEADSSCGVSMNNPFGYQFDVGIGFGSLVAGGKTGAIKTAAIRDDSHGKYSVLVKGEHEKAAIAIAKGAGGLVIGAEESGFFSSAGALVDVLSEDATKSTVGIFRNSGAANTAVQVSNTKGDVRLVTAGAAGGFFTNTAEGDSGLVVNSAKRLHLGRSGGVRATMRIGDNIGIGQGAADSMGGGVGVIFVANAGTVPTTNPTGGGILYTEGGALKFRGSSGTVTTIANA